MIKNQKFHWLTVGNETSHKPVHDRVLFRNERFAALPSLGSFQKNWMLIVPTRPMACLACLNSNEVAELLQIANKVANSLKFSFKSTYIFEHGGAYGSKVSCGVDQAHLHLLELDFNLIDEVIGSNFEYIWQLVPSGWDGLGEFVGEREYLAVGNFDELYVAFPAEPVSQWFRKLIANKLGVPDMWDYKSNPLYFEVLNTAKRFGK